MTLWPLWQYRASRLLRHRLLWQNAYCDSFQFKDHVYHTVKLSDIVTIGYCETFRWSQHCNNKREALYLSLGRGRSHCWKLTTIKKGRRGQCPIDLQRICACRCQISQHFPTKLPSLTDSPSLKPKAGICYARFVWIRLNIAFFCPL